MRPSRRSRRRKPSIIAQSRDQFIKGAIAQGLDRDKAAKIFDLIVHFGGYGFNKSHSTAYALVAFQTAYLKAHYPDRVHGGRALFGNGRRRAGQVFC